MTPDHEAATKWAGEMLRLDSVSPLGRIGNAAACYLDAMARLAKATELKLWKLTREDYGYDEYDGCVVVAKTKEAAIEIGRANCSCTFTSCEEIPMNGEVFVLGSFNAG